jgi:hypothetical protein
MIQLLNAGGTVVREFATQLEACKYCVEHKIANAGWVRHSIKTGTPFYQTSKPYKDYRGFGWKAVKA